MLLRNISIAPKYLELEQESRAIANLLPMSNKKWSTNYFVFGLVSTNYLSFLKCDFHSKTQNEQQQQQQQQEEETIIIARTIQETA